MSTTIALIAVGFFLFIVGTNVWARRKAKAMEGKPAPVASTSDNPALWYFMSPQCGACRAMTPVVRGMAETNGDVHVVDVSKTPEVAMKFGVMATPTTVVVKNGVVDKVFIGARTKSFLEGLMTA